MNIHIHQKLVIPMKNAYESTKMTLQPHTDLHLERFCTVSPSPQRNQATFEEPLTFRVINNSILLDFGESDWILVNCSGSYGFLVDIYGCLLLLNGSSVFPFFCGYLSCHGDIIKIAQFAKVLKAPILGKYRGTG